MIRSFLTYILRAKLSVESLKNMMNSNLRQLLGNLIKTNCTGTLRVRVYTEIEALAIKKRTVKQPGVMHKWNFHYRDTDGVGEYYTPARSGAISLCAVRRCLNQASSYVTEVDSYSKDNGALRQDSIAVMRDGSMTSTIAGTVASVHGQLLQTPFGSLQWQQLHRNGIDDPTAAPIDYCTLNRVGANPTINAVLNQIQHAMTSSTYVHHAVFINHYEQQAITLQAAAEYESMGYVAEYRSLYHSTTDWSTVESILFTGLKRSAEPEVDFQPAGYVRTSTGTLFNGGVYTCEGFHQGFGPNYSGGTRGCFVVMCVLLHKHDEHVATYGSHDKNDLSYRANDHYFIHKDPRLCCVTGFVHFTDHGDLPDYPVSRVTDILVNSSVERRLQTEIMGSECYLAGYDVKQLPEFFFGGTLVPRASVLQKQLPPVLRASSEVSAIGKYGQNDMVRKTLAPCWDPANLLPTRSQPVANATPVPAMVTNATPVPAMVTNASPVPAMVAHPPAPVHVSIHTMNSVAQTNWYKLMEKDYKQWSYTQQSKINAPIPVTPTQFPPINASAQCMGFPSHYVFPWDARATKWYKVLMGKYTRAKSAYDDQQANDQNHGDDSDNQPISGGVKRTIVVLSSGSGEDSDAPPKQLARTQKPMKSPSSDEDSDEDY